VHEFESILVGELDDTDLIVHDSNIFVLPVLDSEQIFFLDDVHLMAQRHRSEKLTNLGVGEVFRIRKFSCKNLFQIRVRKLF
jgi:hypothetical protein